MVALTLQPQEVEVFYILPAIRKEFSYALKELGKSQKEIAKLLGVTEAAVSQYFSQKRATIKFPDELRQKVKEAAPKITDHQTMITQTQAILASSKEGRFICQLHEQVTSHIPKGCSVCFK